MKARNSFKQGLVGTSYTWNLSKGDAEAAHVPDVDGRLQQRLDGGEGRGGLCVVLQPRPCSAGLQLAGTQGVEVAVGGHVGAGGGRQAHHHHQGGPGPATHHDWHHRGGDVILSPPRYLGQNPFHCH